jgi:DNA adenine methylase
MGEQASAWLSAVDGLVEVRHRLARVQILCRDAVDVIRSHDGPGTVFYCDPPYLGETRAASDVYAFEMDEEKHVRLLQTLTEVRGKVILSGYPSAIYDEFLRTWRRVERQVPNHAAGGKTKRAMIECLWLNWQS